MAEKGVLGDLFVVDTNSMAVSCFICAAVSYCSRIISSIIYVVALVAMALAAVSWISLRLFVLLLPSHGPQFVVILLQGFHVRGYGVVFLRGGSGCGGKWGIF